MQSSTLKSSIAKVLFILIIPIVFFLSSCSERIEKPKSYNLLNELSKTKASSKMKTVKDTVNGQKRRVLYTPVPNRVEFQDITLGQNPVLIARYGLNPLENTLSDRKIKFYIELTDRNGKTDRIFEKQIILQQGSKKRWNVFKTVLKSRENSSVDIALGTECIENCESVHSGWSNVEVLNTPVNNSLPNIILISLDALRSDKLSCYGNKNQTSPNIDKLARRSVVYENAYSTSTWTLPSHASMLTGMYPSEHRAISAVPHKAEKAGAVNPLPENLDTLPERLAKRKYYTSGIVSLPYLKKVYNLDQGFLHYNDLMGQNERTGEDVTSLILSNLKTHNNLPFFLFAHYARPHAPYYPPDPDFRTDLPPKFGRYDIRKFSPAKIVQNKLPIPTEEERREIIKRYESGIKYVDFQIGKLLEGLKRLNLFNNTLIIITSDHGEAFGEHNYWSHAGNPYPETTKVPLIISFPGNSSRKRIRKPVSLVSLPSTILKSIGIDSSLPGGINLNPFTGNQIFEGSFGYAEVFGTKSSSRAFAFDDYFYMRTIELKNSQKSVKERLWKNLKKTEKRESLEKARNKYRKFIKRENLSEKDTAPRLKAPEHLSEKTKKALRALGYIN